MHKRILQQQPGLGKAGSTDSDSSKSKGKKAGAGAQRAGGAAVSAGTGGKAGASSSKQLYVPRSRPAVFSSRGITYRYRHLLNDMRELIPHGKKEAKLDEKSKLFVVNEVCEVLNCNSCVFFEVRKKKDLYLWMARVPEGPSVKFLVHGVHTMDELKLTGNHLKGSRPVLSFDASFDSQPHWKVIRELIEQIFSTPKGHKRSKPFIDHVLSFSVVNGQIFLRNYQMQDARTGPGGREELQLLEVGPRATLQPIRVFEGSFGGRTLWDSPDYVSPNLARSLLKRQAAAKARARMQSTQNYTERMKSLEMPVDEMDAVFARD